MSWRGKVQEEASGKGWRRGGGGRGRGGGNWDYLAADYNIGSNRKSLEPWEMAAHSANSAETKRESRQKRVGERESRREENWSWSMSTVGDLENANYAARALPTHTHTEATVAKGNGSQVLLLLHVWVCVSPMAKRVWLQSRSRIRI